MLLHFIIFTTPTERTNDMSGNAALSAARKRRASSTPMGAGVGAQPTQSSAYYNRTTPTTQQLMNQTFPEHNSQSQYTLPRESAPNVPINIYENIELIKQQITARTKTIQTQGSAIPVDKLRILQKQNEIQTQILKQKMAIAQQMEQAEKQQQQEKEQELQQQMSQMAIPSANEPEFIYEKGIPRKNPKYKSPAEIEAMKQARAQARAQAKAPAKAPAQAPAQAQAPSRMTPFVSMVSDTGVIPPPIVILKSHDAKLEEHDNVIQDIIHQLDYLLERVNEASPTAAPTAAATVADADAADADADDEPEQEVLMEVVMNDLTNSREFVEGIVDKIVNDTNLSEVIMKIEPLVKENQELRSLIHSQQQMMNEMNTMLLRLLNSNAQSQSQSTEPEESQSHSTEPEESQQEVFQDEGLDNDGLYQLEVADVIEMTEIVLSTSPVELISEDPDTEPAQIIDLDDIEESAEAEKSTEEPTEESTEEPTEEPTEESTEEPTEESTEESTEEPTEESTDAYSEMPHFPIALIVTELQPRA